MNRLLGWVFDAISDLVCWEHNTRPRRRDDPIVSLIKERDRQAGLAILTFLATSVLILLWAALGPSSGEPPYRGFGYLVHTLDQGFLAVWGATFVLALVQGIRAWTFRPEAD